MTRSTLCSLMLTTLSLLWLAPQECLSQEERRGRFEPGLILETGGRTGACDALTFTTDGKYLLAAGDDKVVRSWAFTGETLQPNQKLRWTIWRQNRGAIYAMALSPDPANRFVAIGGLGARTGIPVLLDRQSGEVIKALPEESKSGSSIWSMAFSPSGKEVAFGTEDGNVWLWNLKGGPKNWGRKLPTRWNKGHRVILVRYLEEQRLITVARDGIVRQWNLAKASPEPEALFKFAPRQVHHVVMSRDHKWVAAAGARAVEIRDLSGRTTIDVPLPQDYSPQVIDFDPFGKTLVVGARLIPQHGPFVREIANQVLLYDLRERPLRAKPGPQLSFYAERFAFHPHGKYLAVAGGSDFEVTLWDLEKLQQGPLSVVQSVGTCLWDVGLSQDNRYLGFRGMRHPRPPSPNQRARGPWRVFDLKTRGWTDPDRFTPVPRLEKLEGWTVRPTSHDPYHWDVISPRQKAYRLLLDKQPDDRPRCYTFLRRRDKQLPWLAVGHYWGLSVYELDEKSTEPVRRIRVMYGHQGYVTALAPSADGRLLLSASRDQTICAWCLDDWQSQAQLGASFQAKLNNLFVTNVDPGSPAWSCGLTKGDKVALFAFDGGDYLYDPERRIPEAVRKRMRASERAQDCLSYLREPRGGREHYFRVDRAGRKGTIELATRVRQRPIWSFFPTRDGEWVLWRYQDYYYDASPQGDSFVGWQINGDVQETPTFFPARVFEGKGRFFRPDKVAEALNTVRFAPDQVRIPDVVPPALSVTLSTTEVRDTPARVTLSCKARGDREFHRPSHVVLWIGDHRYQEWHPKGENFLRNVEIPPKALRHGTNRITLQCFNRAGFSDRAQVVLRKLGKKPKPRLYVLIVGISENENLVGKARHQFPKLIGIKQDYKRMQSFWEAQRATSLYDEVHVTTLTEEDAEPSAVLRQMERMADQARPDDTAIFFFAGHGYVEKDKTGTFVFVGPRFDLDRPSETGLTSEALYEGLTKLACRKLVLLMACRSGDATVATLRGTDVRALTPGGVGPVVFSACRPEESAFVHDFDGSLFTQAIVEALEDNQKLNVRQLGKAIKQRVPELLASLQQEDQKIKDPDQRLFSKEDLRATQTPVTFFPDPGRAEEFLLIEK